MKIGLCKRKKVFNLQRVKIFHLYIQNSSFQSFQLFHFSGLNHFTKKVNAETVFSKEQKFIFLANFYSFLYFIFYHLAESIYNQCFCKIQTLKNCPIIKKSVKPCWWIPNINLFIWPWTRSLSFLSLLFLFSFDILLSKNVIILGQRQHFLHRNILNNFGRVVVTAIIPELP